MAAVATWMPNLQDTFTSALYFAVAVAAAVAGLFIARAVRNWSRREEPTPDFTLQDIREMHARGELSDREFAAMRATILGRLADDAPRRPDPPSPPLPPDNPPAEDA